MGKTRHSLLTLFSILDRETDMGEIGNYRVDSETGGQLIDQAPTKQPTKPIEHLSGRTRSLKEEVADCGTISVFQNVEDMGSTLCAPCHICHKV